MSTPTNEQIPLIVSPLPDLLAWTQLLRRADIPVLQETADALELLRADQDRVDANSLGELISNDPLMTLKVLAYASKHRSACVVTDTETVTAALVLMGISPFFNAFSAQPTVEERLIGEPRALEGLQLLLKRSHRAANLALAFAVQRTDPDAAVIHAVTLLHEFAEMLVWCHAPLLALQIQEMQQNDATLRSSAAQIEVLGIELPDLQSSLMREWKLPNLLAQVLDTNHSPNSAVKTIEYATRLARHTAESWSNEAIPDDIADIATLLNLSPAATLHLALHV